MHLSTVSRNKVLRIIEIVLFLLFIMYVIAHHRHVGMYFDDFGNASLSYGYSNPDVHGTNYTFRQIDN